MMKDVEFSCMQKVMISSEHFSQKERFLQLKTFTGSKISSCATLYHAFFLPKTIQLVQSRREVRLKNRRGLQ